MRNDMDHPRTVGLAQRNSASRWNTNWPVADASKNVGLFRRSFGIQLDCLRPATQAPRFWPERMIHALGVQEPRPLSICCSIHEYGLTRGGALLTALVRPRLKVRTSTLIAGGQGLGG